MAKCQKITVKGNIKRPPDRIRNGRCIINLTHRPVMGMRGRGLLEAAVVQEALNGGFVAAEAHIELHGIL